MDREFQTGLFHWRMTGMCSVHFYFLVQFPATIVFLFLCVYQLTMFKPMEKVTAVEGIDVLWGNGLCCRWLHLDAVLFILLNEGRDGFVWYGETVLLPSSEVWRRVNFLLD